LPTVVVRHIQPSAVAKKQFEVRVSDDISPAQVHVEDLHVGAHRNKEHALSVVSLKDPQLRYEGVFEGGFGGGGDGGSRRGFEPRSPAPSTCR